MWLSVLALSLSVISCNKEESLNQTNNPSIKEIGLNISEVSKLKEESFNTMVDELYFFKNTDKLIGSSETNKTWNENDAEKVIVESSALNRDNLNNVLLGVHSSKNILAITFLKKEKEGFNGIIIHYTDEGLNLRLNAYKNEGNNVFKLVEISSNLVAGFTMDNLLFIAREFFSKSNIITYAVKSIGTQIFSSSCDDIALLRFAYKYNLLSHCDKYTMFKNQNTNNKQVQDLPGKKPCAIGVHHCMYGDEIRVACHPFDGGCYPLSECPKEIAENEFSNYGMEAEYQMYVSNLKNKDLYSFRDWLETTPQGMFFPDSYYALSEHFRETVDMELLFDVASSSKYMKEFVFATMEDNPNYILTTEIFNRFTGIIEKSKQNSNNKEYKEVIDKVLNKLRDYENKNIQDIKELLSRS